VIIKDNNLIKIYFIGFIICIGVLYYLDLNQNLEISKVLEIKFSDINKYKSFEVKLISQNLKKSILFLKFKDLNSNSSINGIIFNFNKSLKLNEDYIIIGKIDFYRNKSQILIDELKLLKYS